MSRSRRSRRFAALLIPALALAIAAPAGAAPPPTDPPATDPTTAAPETTAPTPPSSELAPSASTPEGEWTATPVAPDEIITASKTSSIAQTDPALLGRSDATPVQVMIKLDYDSVATYTGGVAGLAPTSPSVTGQPLSGETPAEVAYDGFIEGEEANFEAELAAAVPAAEVGQSLRTVYGGVAAVVPANEVDAILAIPNVVAVQTDQLNQLLTDSSPEFIGATELYAQMGVADSQAGASVVFGVLDSGAWPEHPSLADQGNLGAPPAKADATPRACDFGDNPLTPAPDPFACNNKLIGGQAFLDTYLQVVDTPEPYETARDSNGHGTHTGTTTAGNAVASAPVLGVDRGPLHGIAPGAWVSVYKVCGIEGCFASDSAAAVEQAILDGVDVINFSISGGTSPYTDPAELAFLDAYAAGVFVATSAGNDGPGAGTANHLAPWTTTVAASTQSREFQSSLTVTAGANTYTATGASITAGAGPAEVVLSSAAPYGRALCDAPAAPGQFTGKIVACQRGVNARVEKGFNVLQGGAVGMILYNLPPTTDVETDNHWLPTVHLADGTDLVAFLGANPGSSATFTPGQAGEGQGDVMASFSSRGPAGDFLKPDITAPGVQILAGHTPTPESPLEGPPDQYFQAIAGTSMSSPHIAGSAVLLAAMHPDWTPMELRSAMMLTAATDVVKEDGITPTTPFDDGAGRVDLGVAGSPGLVMDETAANMAALAVSDETGVHLNQPSINADTMPGRLTTTRTFTNVQGRVQYYEVQTTVGEGSSIVVEPSRFTIQPGQSMPLTITIESTAATGTQQFGEIRLIPRGGQAPALHLPVAFIPTQGQTSLSQDCAADSIARGESTTCTITATNTSLDDTTVDLRTFVNSNLELTAATAPAVLSGGAAVVDDAVLAGGQLGIPSVDPGDTFGYVPLDAFGGTIVTPVGDEQFVNFNVPAFSYNGETYTRIGLNSNGYVVAGGGTSQDNNCCNLPTGPSPARPNNMVAPFWTDLDGTGAPGVMVNILTDGVNDWIVAEWRVNDWGTTRSRVFQTWIGINGVQDISMTYKLDTMTAAPTGQDYLVGAENAAGQGDVASFVPTGDLVVTSTDPTPGASLTYDVTVRGAKAGDGIVTTEMTGPDLPGGTTVVSSGIAVIR